MKISTKGRYALRVMIDLAMNDNGEFISLKDISKRQGVSVKYLEQIVSLLNKQGLLQTARGNNGGYKLNKEVDKYTVGEILRAAEGDMSPITCVKEEAKCDKKAVCLTYNFWKGLDDAINEYIDSKTLADLID